MALRGYEALMLMGTKPWEQFLRTVVTVTTTATALPTTALADRKGIWLFNIAGSVPCFLSLGSDVQASNEASIVPRENMVIPVTDHLTVYGRVASGTATIICWEYV